MPVVLVVLDAFPFDAVDPALTPTLAALAAEGGWNPEGGVGELTAATYPNHATFVTGVPTVDHGIVTNRVLRDGTWVSSATTGPTATTLFDRCATAGRSSLSITGDHNLVGVCGAETADHHWPPGGRKPDGAATGVMGYLADAEVAAAAERMAPGDHDFVFVQIDEVDSARHVYGAHGEEAREQCRATDAALGRVLDSLRSTWADTVVLVVSDHDQEDYAPDDPIDLAAHLSERPGTPVELAVETQGTAAQVVGPVDEEVLRAVPGVTGVARLAPEIHIVWGDDGRRFGTGATDIRADHGSPRTRRQLAVVGGGDPRVGDLARRITSGRPPATAWARWAADLLDLP